MKNNRKGFTTVELVIVIAVIAILATVLIPTFSSLVTKANESKALQEARNTYTEWLIDQDFSNGVPTDDLYIVVDGMYFIIEDGEMASTADDEAPTAASGYSYVADTTYTNVYVLTETP